MKQLKLAAKGFERYAKTTRRARFLAEMERVVPWPALCGLIEPFCPKAGNGRPPLGVERMLRIYFLQQWVLLEQMAEAAHRRLVRHRLAAEIDADQIAHGPRIVERLFRRRVRQVEPTPRL